MRLEAVATQSRPPSADLDGMAAKAREAAHFLKALAHESRRHILLVLRFRGGRMTARKGSGEANLAFSLQVADWRDAVLGRNGATLSLIVPPARPGRPDNSARAKQLKGTLALDLARDGNDPVRMEMAFNDAATPRTVMKMKLADYVAMQEGRLNGQEAFMTGKLKVEGDLGFLMQIAALNV